MTTISTMVVRSAVGVTGVGGGNQSIRNTATPKRIRSSVPFLLFMECVRSDGRWMTRVHLLGKNAGRGLRKRVLSDEFPFSGGNPLDWRGEGLGWITLDKSGFLLYF